MIHHHHHIRQYQHGQVVATRATRTPSSSNPKHDLILRLESPFGVRKRVRAVLDRVKKRRTRDDSTSPSSSPSPSSNTNNQPSVTSPTTKEIIPYASSSSSSSTTTTSIFQSSYNSNTTFITSQSSTTAVSILSTNTATQRMTTVVQQESLPSIQLPELTTYDTSPIISSRANLSQSNTPIESSSIPPNHTISERTSPLTSSTTTPTTNTSGPILTLTPPSPTSITTTTTTTEAAVTSKIEPLPFTLPNLSQQQILALNQGQRIQVQENMGRQGYGYVVVDVKAPVDVVWHCLLDFYSYPQTIPTVRHVQMLTNTHLGQDYHSESELTQEDIRTLYEDGTLATLKYGIPSVTRAVFTLSKFQLKIAAIHKYRPHPLGDYMIFTLDPACTNVVLQMAKGTWHTQSNPDGKGKVCTNT